MDPSPAQGEDGPAAQARDRSLIARAAELPSRLLLSVVSAGVIAGLAMGAASVWLAAALDRARGR